MTFITARWTHMFVTQIIKPIVFFPNMLIIPTLIFTLISPTFGKHLGYSNMDTPFDCSNIDTHFCHFNFDIYVCPSNINTYFGPSNIYTHVGHSKIYTSNFSFHIAFTHFYCQTQCISLHVELRLLSDETISYNCKAES